MTVHNALGVLIGTIVVSFVLSLFFYRRDPEFGKVIAAVQALISIGALVVAAYWYFVERKGMPHADIHASAQVAKIGVGAALVMTRVDVKNEGTGLLTIKDRDVRLLAAHMGKETLGTVLAYEPTKFPPTLPSGRALFDNGEVAWRGLRQYISTKAIQIEPGETDSVFVDFIVPCTEGLVKLTASVRKPGEEDLWYKDRKLISLGPICSGSDAPSDLQPVKIGETP